MKYTHNLFLIIALLVLSSCNSFSVGYNEYYAIGKRNANNQPEGEWTVYHNDSFPALFGAAQLNDSYYVFAKGTYSDGKPDGLWIIWDKQGQKLNEMSFKNGELNGDTKIFNTYYPTPNLDKPVIAHFENCQLKSINGYENNKLKFATILTKNSGCNKSFAYITEPKDIDGTTIVRTIELTIFDGEAAFPRDGYVTIIKNAPLHSAHNTL